MARVVASTPSVGSNGLGNYLGWARMGLRLARQLSNEGTQGTMKGTAACVI